MIETRPRPSATTLRRPPGVRPSFAWIAPAIAAVLWPAIALCILSHRIFVSNDSISTYAHVWFIAQAIWEHGTLPLHMPLLNHGEGYAFPYGAPPWAIAALLWHFLNEWSVTLMLVVGVAAATAAAVLWQPALRRPLLLAIFLLNPFLIEAAVLAQFPFLWAAVFFFLGAAALTRDRYGWAAACLALAQLTHPAIMLPPVAVLAGATYWHTRQRAVLRTYAIALVVAVPAVVLTLRTPALSDNGTLAVLLNYVGTLAPRMLVLVAPVAIVRYAACIQRHAVKIAVAAVVLPLAALPALGDLWAVKQLVRVPSTTAVAAVSDQSFAPGSIYRVLDAADGKMSMYRLLRAGAVLDGDFFPESLGRQSWRDADGYLAFLRGRRVEYVFITRAYDRDFRTNEHALLNNLVETDRAARIYRDARVDVYRITYDVATTSDAR